MDQVKTQPNFPYLSDKDIHDLDLSVMYRILGSLKVSDSEVHLIKQKRRRLQKLQFKQNKELASKNFLEETGEKIVELKNDKEELITNKMELVNEIEYYKTCLQQDN